MLDVNNFEYMKIGLASPDKIRSWSHGEVKNLKPSTTERLNLNVMAYSVKEFWTNERLGMFLW